MRVTLMDPNMQARKQNKKSNISLVDVVVVVVIVMWIWKKFVKN